MSEITRDIEIQHNGETLHLHVHIHLTDEEARRIVAPALLNEVRRHSFVGYIGQTTTEILPWRDFAPVR